MGAIINLYAGASGLWKKIAAFLPIVLGLGSLLSGLAGFCLEFGHAANAAALLALAQKLQSDPNTGLVLAGLAALGIHTNHQDNKAAIIGETVAPISTPVAPPPDSPKP